MPVLRYSIHGVSLQVCVIPSRCVGRR